jgi:hypothetical protein
LAAVVYFAIFDIRTIRTETLQLLVQNNVRVGEHSESVIRFLGRQKLDPSDVIQPQVTLIGGHDYAGQRIVLAEKRYSASALVWRESIYLVFVFDENRKLLKYGVFPEYESF